MVIGPENTPNNINKIQRASHSQKPVKKAPTESSNEKTKDFSPKKELSNLFNYNLDKKEIQRLSEESGNARGGIEKSNTKEWSSAAAVKPAPSLNDLSQSARAVVAKLRSISDDSIRNSDSFKKLQDLGHISINDEGFGL